MPKLTTSPGGTLELDFLCVNVAFQKEAKPTIEETRAMVPIATQAVPSFVTAAETNNATVTTKENQLSNISGEVFFGGTSGFFANGSE